MVSPQKNPNLFRISDFGFRIWTILFVLIACRSHAALTNAVSTLSVPPSLPDAGPSLLRVMGGLALVLGLFLGGVWLFRHGQQFRFARGRPARLNILEVRSLGGRHALYVVGYEQERFLVGSTPAGISLLSHLAPCAEKGNETNGHDAPTLSFAQSLAQVLRGRTSASARTEVLK